MIADPIEFDEALDAIKGYPRNFSQLAAQLGGPEWLQVARRTAMSTFLAQGFPGRKNEEWKYTSVRKLIGTELSPAPAPSTADIDLAEFGVPSVDGHLLVFVNGHFRADLSKQDELPEGVVVSSLSEVLANSPETIESYLNGRVQEGFPFADLNTAFFQDGAFIQVPRSKVLTAPVHLVFVADASNERPAVHVRNIIVAAENSQVSVIETYVGRGAESYLTNTVTEVHLGENAVVDHNKIEDETRSAFHIGKISAWVPRSANFRQVNITLGGALVRNDIDTVLEGQGASCMVNGLYLPSGKQHVDNHTSIDHTAAKCESHQLYKGILHGSSTAVFNGKIFVREGAQQTNADQSNPNLLLSNRAHVDTKPQLEIWADDVRCTHGATIGQIEDKPLFYMRSRGIPEKEARALLTYAFANDVIDDIVSESIREVLQTRLLAWFDDSEAIGES